MGIYIWANFIEVSGGFSQQTMFDCQRAHIKGENVSNQKIMTASFLKVLEGVQQVGNALRFTQPGASASQFPEEHQGTGHGQRSHHTSIPWVPFLLARNVKFWTASLERCRQAATIQARDGGFALEELGLMCLTIKIHQTEEDDD